MKKESLEIYFLWGCLLAFLSVNAQTDSILTKKADTIKKQTTWQLLKYDGKNVWGGIKHAYTQPFHWQKGDLIAAGGIIAGTFILYTIDTDANTYFTEQEEHVPGLIKDFGWYFGSPQNNYGLSAGIYAFGLFTKNEKIRKTGVLMIASATASGIIQSFSKTIVGRARPTTGEGKHSFDFFSNEPGFHSFPSGHAVLSFTTAHAIAKQFSSVWVKSGIYAVGLITPVSRLWEGAHWLTDVALGMALSVVVVDGIDNFLNKEEKYTLHQKPKVAWNLKLGTGTIGFVGTF